MKPSLTELEELAKAATPGPWSNMGVNKSYTKKIESSEGLIGFCHTNHMAKKSLDNGIDNARFIAAASPDTVLKLIEAVRVLREGLKECSDYELHGDRSRLRDQLRHINIVSSEALTTVEKFLGE